MEAEPAFDKIVRRTSAILGLALTGYIVVMSIPPLRSRCEALQRDAQYKVKYLLRRARNLTRMPWERELMDETEKMRSIVLPQSKPGWFKKVEHDA